MNVKYVLLGEMGGGRGVEDKVGKTSYFDEGRLYFIIYLAV